MDTSHDGLDDLPKNMHKVRDIRNQSLSSNSPSASSSSGDSDLTSTNDIHGKAGNEKSYAMEKHTQHTDNERNEQHEGPERTEHNEVFPQTERIVNNQFLDQNEIKLIPDQNIVDSASSSITNSPSLNALDALDALESLDASPSDTGAASTIIPASKYTNYAGAPPHSSDEPEPLKFVNRSIYFEDENPPLDFHNANIRISQPPAISSPESVNSPDLPIFSSRSGNASPAQKLEANSYSSLGLPYIYDKSAGGSFASVDDDISLNADMSSLLNQSETPRQLPTSMSLDADVFSDSDGGRDGFHSGHNPTFYSSALELEGGPSNATPSSRRKRKQQSQMNILTPSPAPGRQRKTPRRKSRNSEANSEKSHRSEFHLGSGYTQTPTSGKIFRNLLILEESLRQQVIQQRTLRRKYLTFLAALCSLIAGITHYLYFSEHLGPFRVLLQLLLLMLVVTLLLYHLSGEYQKTIVLPKKFLSSTNKGLRQLNVRLVKIKTTYVDSSADLIREFGLFLCSMALKFCHTAFPSMISNPNSKLEIWLVLAQLRCQPRFGLNDVKLVLIPRSFSTDIREGWELYRNEFWVNEGVRRRNAALEFTKPKVVKKLTKEKARKRRPSAPPLPLLSEHNINQLEENPLG